MRTLPADSIGGRRAFGTAEGEDASFPNGVAIAEAPQLPGSAQSSSTLGMKADAPMRKVERLDSSRSTYPHRHHPTDSTLGI